MNRRSFLRSAAVGLAAATAASKALFAGPAKARQPSDPSDRLAGYIRELGLPNERSVWDLWELGTMRIYDPCAQDNHSAHMRAHAELARSIVRLAPTDHEAHALIVRHCDQHAELLYGRL